MASTMLLLLGSLLVVAAGTYLGVLGALRTYFGVEPPFGGAAPGTAEGPPDGSDDGPADER